MAKTKSWKLMVELALRRKSEIIPELELHRELYNLGEMAIQDGNLDIALDSYMEVNDKERIREVGEMCIERGSYIDACLAFRTINYREGILKLIKSIGEKDRFVLELAWHDYLGSASLSKVNDRFEQWASEKGIIVPYGLDWVPMIDMAYHISGNYDIGIGIARGGLISAYIFSLFNLPVKVAECHKNDDGTAFSWVDNINKEELERKNVLVFDKDVVSGRTAERVLEEIQRYSPNNVSIALNHNPVTGPCGIGTIHSNIPKGYSAVHYPKDFNYQHFDEAVESLEQKIYGQLPALDRFGFMHFKAVRNAFELEGIQDTEHLIGISWRRLIKYKGFGFKTMEIVESELAKHGLRLMEPYQQGKK